jgi:hypothetical protein
MRGKGEGLGEKLGKNALEIQTRVRLTMLNLEQ